MGTYQLRDASGTSVWEETFEDFSAASARVLTTEDLEDGWTLFEKAGGDWIPAQRDPYGE